MAPSPARQGRRKGLRGQRGSTGGGGGGNEDSPRLCSPRLGALGGKPPEAKTGACKGAVAEAGTVAATVILCRWGCHLLLPAGRVRALHTTSAGPTKWSDFPGRTCFHRKSHTPRLLANLNIWLYVMFSTAGPESSLFTLVLQVKQGKPRGKRTHAECELGLLTSQSGMNGL